MDFRWWLVFGWCFCCWLLGSVLREQLNHCIQRCGWTFADELCLQRCADAEDWHTHVNIVAGALYFLSSLFLCSFAENCEGKCQIYIYYMYWNKCKVGSCIRCMCMLHLRDSILLWLIYENSILCLCEHCYFVCCCYCYFINFFSSVLSFDMLKANANNRNLYAVGCFSSLPVAVVVLRMLHDTTTNPITWTYIIYGYTVYSIHLHGINVEIMYVYISGCRGPYSLRSPHMQKYTPSISHFISNWKDELYCGGPEKSYQVRQTISLPLTTTTKP